MDPIPATVTSLAKLLEASGRPIYAVDPLRQIAFCNSALCDWLGLEPRQIAGRDVEYHSESDIRSATSPEAAGSLPGLCPPPRAMAGHRSTGTVSCVARDGRLLHRRAEFVPLAAPAGAALKQTIAAGVLVVLEPSDLSTAELAAELSDDATTDELHRAIRRFRRTQAEQYAIETLLGGSTAMRKVRAQAAAAAASGANVLVRGPRGSGRSHVARAVHYQAPDAGGLVPVDCELVSEDLLRRRLDSLRTSDDSQHRPTLLLVNLDRLSEPLGSQLLHAVAARSFSARVVATVCDPSGQPSTAAESAEPPAAEPTGEWEPRLYDLVSTITIRLPRLADRSEDLPILAQSFLETCNRDSAKQVGSVRPEALELLALYGWPGELDELRQVMAAAHEACNSHEIRPADLPAVIHHAARAASLPRRQPERIVLDDLLASIEKELIGRALGQAGGNKTEAARLLGMTRPRLYRRLEQLGLAGESSLTDQPSPDDGP
jgi:DNA-binding NtrC family response regulator